LRRKFGEGIDDEVKAQRKACREGGRRISIEYARKAGMRSDYEKQVVKQNNVAEFTKQSADSKERNEVEINSSIYVHLVVVEISFLVVTTLALCRLLILFSPEIGIASQARVRCCHVTSPLDGAFADAFLTSS
jgi:hypothetical protein